jgi:hypothetical protein
MSADGPAWMLAGPVWDLNRPLKHSNEVVKKILGRITTIPWSYLDLTPSDTLTPNLRIF